jgi:hypothetical protein
MAFLEVSDGRSTISQSREAVRWARELRARHPVLADRCRAAVIAALETCETSWGLRGDPSPPRIQCVFYLRASVDDELRLAIWRTNRLLCHPELRARAELVVRLGETFQVPELERSVKAGLEEPLPAALTLMRAADEILEFELRLNGLRVTYRAVAGEADDDG